MDFEKVYQKFLDGTATPEEIEFVRSELKRAKEIGDVLNRVKSEGATNEPSQESVKKEVNTYRKRDFKKIVLIVGAVLIILFAIASVSIGYPIYSHAKENTNYTLEDAKQIAITYVEEHHHNHNHGSHENCHVEVYHASKEMDVEGRLKNAHYIYCIEVHNGHDRVIEVEVDSKTGQIIDID